VKMQLKRGESGTHTYVHTSHTNMVNLIDID